MSAVKARLKLFESNQDSEEMANVARGIRPPLANKPPVLTKFPKANEDANSIDTQPTRPVNKWGPAVVPNLNQEALAAAKNSLNKGSAPPAAVVNHSHDKTSGPIDFKMALKPVDNRRVPKVFQTDEASDSSKPTEPPGKVAIKPPTGVKTALVPNKLSVTTNSSNTSHKEDKSPDSSEPGTSPVIKPWNKTALTPTVTAAANSTTQSSTETSTPVVKPWGSKTALTTSPTPNSQNSSPGATVGAASVARSWGTKTALTPSTTTQSSQVSSSHTPVKSWNVKVSSPSSVTTSPATPPVPTPTTTSDTSSSSSSQSSQETVDENGKGKFDFRSQMKQRNSITSLGSLTKTADNQRSPMTDITPKNPESIKNAVTAVSHSEAEVVMRSSPGKKPGTIQDKKRQSSNIIIERKSDQKKFKKIKLTTLPPESAVRAKPTLPSGIDLTQIKVEYQKKIQDLKAESDEANAAVNEDDDEIYDEGCSAPSPVLPRRPTFKRNSDRVSMIPDMPPEEEGEIYDDGISQPTASDDIYADGETEKKEDSEFEDVYEDEESLAKPVETEEDKKRRLKEEADTKKRVEKERKEKEKLEKEQKKKEEKEKKEKAKLIKKLNMTGSETSAGEGTIKQDSKGSGLSLTVKKGQTVTILRLENNPPNKWLVKTDENTFGYVDSKNIEIDPSIIRQAMGNARKNSRALDDDDQPTYDEPPNGTADDEIEEEIYEEL